MKLSTLAKDLKPFITPWIQAAVTAIETQIGTTGSTGGGLEAHALDGAYHTGTLGDSQAPQFLKTDGSRALTGNLSVSAGVTIDGIDISAHAANPAAHHDPVTAGDGIVVAGQQVSVDVTDLLGAGITEVGGDNNLRVDQGYAFAWTANHTHAGNVTFTGAARTISSDSTNNLTLGAGGNLILDPTGNIILPNAQEMRTVDFNDLVTGISGFRLFDRGSNYRQLTIGAMKMDELYARVFVADETRIDRGEEYWSKSYGIVAADFTVPADTATRVYVTFEDAPGLGTANLFSANDYLLIRTVDWSTGIVISKTWWWVEAFADRDNTAKTQRWQLFLRSGGTSGQTIKAGNVALDVGASGQGWVHLSALAQDKGPFIQMGDWATNRGTNSPNARPYHADAWTNYVRMGNLNGVGGISSDTWGFAAAKSLGTAIGSGFEGLVLDATNGLRMYNLNLEMWDSGTGKRTGVWTSTGYLYLGTDTGTTPGVGSGNSVAYFPNSGNFRLGDSTAANALWNMSAGQLQFRGGTTVQAYVDTDGSIKAGAGAVTLSSSGLRLVNSSGAYLGAASMEWQTGSTTYSKTYGYVSGGIAYLMQNSGNSSYAGAVHNFVQDTTGTKFGGIYITHQNIGLTINTGSVITSLQLADNAVASLQADGFSLVGATVATPAFTMPNNSAIQMKDSGGTARSVMYMSTGDNLAIGYGVQAGKQVSIGPGGSVRLSVSDTAIAAELPMLLKGSSTITSAPPSTSSSGGWKATMYGASYALGIATYTMAFRTAASGWLALFNNANPADDAGTTTPDSNAAWAVNATRMAYTGTLGAAWASLSLDTGANWGNTNTSTYHAAGYKRFGDLVILRGNVTRSSGSGASNITGTALPTGFRPAKRVAVRVYDTLLYIETTGHIAYQSGTQSGISLENITFSVDAA